jgi:hypothetical protein
MPIVDGMPPTRDEQDLASIENWFVYHPPKGNQQERYAYIRSAALYMAQKIVALVPAGPDRTVALRKLRECVMTANAGIACDDTAGGIRDISG